MYCDHAVAIDQFAMFQPISFILWCMAMLSGKQNSTLYQMFMLDTRLYTCNFDLHSAEELIQLVSKLEQSTDVDASCRLSRQIFDFLELHVNDYRTNQVGRSMLHTHTYTYLLFLA